MVLKLLLTAILHQRLTNKTQAEILEKYSSLVCAKLSGIF